MYKTWIHIVFLANIQAPRFFNLGAVDLNIQDAPKVDGLVSSLHSVNVTEYCKPTFICV